MDYKELSNELVKGEQNVQNVTKKLANAMSSDDAFKELAEKLNTSVQTVPNLVKVLSEAFANMEGGGGGDVRAQVWTFYGDKYQSVVTNTVKANHTGKLYAMIGEAYHSTDPVLEINGVAVTPIKMDYNWIGYAYYEADVNIDDEIDFTYNGNGGGSTGFVKLIVIK